MITYVPSDSTETDLAETGQYATEVAANATSNDFAIETIDHGTLPAEPTAQPKVG